MKCTIPEISWHNRDPVLSVDIQPTKGNFAFYRLATGGTDSHVLIWLLSLEQGGVAPLECAADLTRHSRPVNCVRFSPSGEFLASGDDDSSIIVWKMKTSSDPAEFPSGEEENFKEQWISVKVLRGHLQDVYDLSWSADSKNLISGSVDNTAILWEVSSGKNLGILGDHKGFVQGVAWDPCGQYVATMSSDRVCRVFNSTTRKVVSKMYKGKLPGDDPESKPTHYFHDDTLKSFFRRLTFTPDGKFLIVPSGVDEELDKTENCTLMFSRHCFNKPIVCLPSRNQYTVAVRCCPTLFTLRRSSFPSLFDMPYRVIIAVATQHSVTLYDTQHAAPFAIITNIHYTRITDLTWSSDGRVLVVSSTDGYCSVITFLEDEFGSVYTGQKEEEIEVENLTKECSENKDKEVITSQETEKSKSADVEKCPKKPIEMIVLDPTEDANMCADMNDKTDGNGSTVSKLHPQLLPPSDNSSKSTAKSVVNDVKETLMEVDDFQLVYEGTVTEPVLESGSTTKAEQKIEAEPCETGAKSTSLEIEKTAAPLVESPEKLGDVASNFQKESTSPKSINSGKTNTTPGNSNKKAPRRVQLITLSSPRSRKKLLS